MAQLESLEIAGVPLLLKPPEVLTPSAPLIILWHGFGTPGSEQSLAETLPLSEVNAWKAYLTLPLCGVRLPPGGMDELNQLVQQDYLLKLFLPIVQGASQELPNVVTELGKRFEISVDRGIGLFGFSIGGFTVLRSLLEKRVAVQAVVMAGVSKDVLKAVEMIEKTFNFQYLWTEASQTASQLLDFQSQAREIAQNTPALLFIHGREDEIFPPEEVEQLYQSLQPYYEKSENFERLALKVFSNLKHQIEPPSPQLSPELNADYTELQKITADWFIRYLK